MGKGMRLDRSDDLTVARNIVHVRILTVLVAIVYAASAGWMAALGETIFAYYGGLLTICSYAVVIFLTFKKKKILRGAR